MGSVKGPKLYVILGEDSEGCVRRAAQIKKFWDATGSRVMVKSKTGVGGLNLTNAERIVRPQVVILVVGDHTHITQKEIDFIREYDSARTEQVHVKKGACAEDIQAYYDSHPFVYNNQGDIVLARSIPVDRILPGRVQTKDVVATKLERTEFRFINEHGQGAIGEGYIRKQQSE